MTFRLRTPSGSEIAHAIDDNIDVIIELEDGRTFAATFFTIANLQTLMRRYRLSGECAGGTYVWARDMIVVETISYEIVEKTVADLLTSGEMENCCTQL